MGKKHKAKINDKSIYGTRVDFSVNWESFEDPPSVTVAIEKSGVFVCVNCTHDEMSRQAANALLIALQRAVRYAGSFAESLDG